MLKVDDLFKIRFWGYKKKLLIKDIYCKLCIINIVKYHSKYSFMQLQLGHTKLILCFTSPECVSRSIQTNDKPDYKCDVCDKTFSQSIKVPYKYKRIHTCEKPASQIFSRILSSETP